MTLSRQLILLLVTLIVLLFLGTLAISVSGTRDYLESQLASHAQDAATSLGLSATSHVNSNDEAMVTTMVNAMFHRGDYLNIRFEKLSGETWIERDTELRVDTVPDWFISLFTLDPPQRSATMMSGWHQVGQVVVTSHPGLAYEKLWLTARRTLNLFLISVLLVVAVGVLALRVMLKPLKAVERQAAAICNREFVVVEGRPFTLEFRRVVEAMNQLSSKIARLLTESEQTAGRLRQQAFQDPVTGLANRRQFMDVLAHRIDDPELVESSGLLLLQLRDFKAFNQARGYVEGDQMLAATGELISEVLTAEPRATIAHLSGADFAVLFEGVDHARLSHWAHELTTQMAGLHKRFELSSPDVAHVGAALYAGQDLSGFLSTADMALREAQRAGANAWVVHAGQADTGDARPGGEWRSLIERAIETKRFTLLRQAVVSCPGRELLHHEVFLRIADPRRPGEDIPAGVFMPMAESAGLAPQVDRAVIERVLQSMAGSGGDVSLPGRVAVNLSPLSLADRDFIGWLKNRLLSVPALAARLIVELPEYGASADLTRLQDWIAQLAPLGIEFSLDHFGKGFTSFAYLRRLKVHYLKIDGSFVRNLDQHEDNQFFIKSVADIAHGLDMRVVAESVETELVWQILQDMGADAGRGYWLGHPE